MSVRIQSAIADAIVQRRIAAGFTATRCLSGSTTASSRTRSSPPQPPGPWMSGMLGAMAISSDSASRQAEGGGGAGAAGAACFCVSLSTGAGFASSGCSGSVAGASAGRGFGSGTALRAARPGAASERPAARTGRPTAPATRRRAFVPPPQGRQRTERQQHG